MQSTRMRRMVWIVLFFALACGALIWSTTSVADPTSGPTLAGEYIWLSTARADNRDAQCQAMAAGNDCVELCMVVNNTGSMPMNKYCCIDPGDIGGWDNPTECDLWIP